MVSKFADLGRDHVSALQLYLSLPCQVLNGTLSSDASIAELVPCVPSTSLRDCLVGAGAIWEPFLAAFRYAPVTPDLLVVLARLLGALYGRTQLVGDVTGKQVSFLLVTVTTVMSTSRFE